MLKYFQDYAFSLSGIVNETMAVMEEHVDNDEATCLLVGCRIGKVLPDKDCLTVLL